MINAAETIYRNPQDIVEIGDNLRHMREERNLSQEKLGMMIDVESSRISRYERGMREMGVTTFVQLLEALNAYPEEILPRRIRQTNTLTQKKARVIRLMESIRDEDIDLLVSMAERLTK